MPRSRRKLKTKTSRHIHRAQSSWFNCIHHCLHSDTWVTTPTSSPIFPSLLSTLFIFLPLPTLTTELALTLACSLILSRLDYCNAVLHGAPASSIQKLQRVQNTAARIVLQVPAVWRQSPSQPLLEELHWLPVRQRIDYKLAVLTYKIQNT